MKEQRTDTEDFCRKSSVSASFALLFPGPQRKEMCMYRVGLYIFRYIIDVVMAHNYYYFDAFCDLNAILMM